MLYLQCCFRNKQRQTPGPSTSISPSCITLKYNPTGSAFDRSAAEIKSFDLLMSVAVWQTWVAPAARLAATAQHMTTPVSIVVLKAALKSKTKDIYLKIQSFEHL